MLYIHWANSLRRKNKQAEGRWNVKKNAKWFKNKTSKKQGGVFANNSSNPKGLVGGGDSSDMIPRIWFSFNEKEQLVPPTPKKKKDPPPCYRNVSLCVGAPVRVNLRGLVRRLLYSHLTPSTLSSPSPPPSSVLQCTPILTLPLPPTTSLHGWICLVLRSTHVCCLPWRENERKREQRERWDWVSLSLSGQPRLGAAAAETPFRKATAPAGGVRVEAGRASCTHTHTHMHIYTHTQSHVYSCPLIGSVFLVIWGSATFTYHEEGSLCPLFDWVLGWRVLRCFSTEKPRFAGSGFRPFLFFLSRLLSS